MRLYPDGRIEVSYSGVNTTGALVGITPGGLQGATSIVSCEKMRGSEVTSSKLWKRPCALTFSSLITAFGLGGEMPPLMALSWGAWLMMSRSRWALAAFLAGLAAVTRGDAVFVGASMALVFAWTHHKEPVRSWPWYAAIIYFVTVAPWYLFAWSALQSRIYEVWHMTSGNILVAAPILVRCAE